MFAFRDGAGRALRGAHALGAAFFLWLQPRGFSAGSRSFWEHQVLVPLFFALALFAAACPARWPRAAAASGGALAGFWLALSATIGAVGSTLYGRALWGVFAASLALGALALRRETARAFLAGAVPGALLAAAFLVCTWAPPASTRPPFEPHRPFLHTGNPPRTRPKTRLSVRDRWVVVERGGDELAIDPGFRFDAASPSGLWTVFDFRSFRLPPWEWDDEGARSLFLMAQTDVLQAFGRAWIEADGVHVYMATTLKKEIASHLSAVMTVQAPGRASVEGVEWPADDPACFVAFREGSLALLRASRREKGPFQTLAAWTPRDPVIELGAWSLQVRAWADQASREESPTAGWGVSQGAIERRGDRISWSLASTSIGRGWHAVRTAPGTYALEAVIRPR